MLKKKIASVLTAAIRLCPKCGTRCTLSATESVTKCIKCGTIVNTNSGNIALSKSNDNEEK